MRIRSSSYASANRSLLDIPVLYPNRNIIRIKEIMLAYEHRIHAELLKIYSQDLRNNRFRYPYTRIESVQDRQRGGGRCRNWKTLKPAEIAGGSPLTADAVPPAVQQRT